jgi:predicted RNase H-like HicB family nuclease
MKTNEGFLKEIRYKGHTLLIYKEHDPEETGYKMYAEAKDLPGCIIAGDTEKEILTEAPKVFDVYLEAQREIAGKKSKLISVKVKPELYDFLVRYANDQGIENVSTVVRSLAVSKLREEGYYINAPHAVSRVAEPEVREHKAHRKRA